MGLIGKSTRAPALPWARIQSVRGAASDVVYTDAAGVTWRCVQWNASDASGLLIAAPGVVEGLVVSGGSGARTAVWGAGAGGSWIEGLLVLASGPHAVVVGAGGSGTSYENATGKPSGLGSVRTNIAPLWPISTYASLTSAITGSSVEYARADQASPAANRGDGGDDTGDVAGSTGVVIIRTPV